MKSDTNLSRRRLLARIPAVAAAAVPATAVALPGLPAAIPEHVDLQELERHNKLMAMLDGLPKGEANKVLTAITEVIECSMQTHEHDAELMALKPQFDVMFETWWQRREDGRRRHREFEAELERRTGLTRTQYSQLERYSPESKAYLEARDALACETSWGASDEEVDRTADEEHSLIDKILSYSPLTRDGLRLQCRALIMDCHCNWHHDTVASFIGRFVLFFNIELPNGLAAELLGWGQDWNDEDEEEEGEAEA